MGLTISDSLGESLRDMNRFLHNSELYRKRPGAKTSKKGDAGTAAPSDQPSATLRRWRVDAETLQEKNAALKKGREEYRQNP